MNNAKARKDAGEKEALYTVWWECKLVQPLWEPVQRFLKKIKIASTRP
jgi:hypothetical protein